MKPRIELKVATHDGASSKITITDPHTNDAMFAAAWDLLYTMTAGKRPKKKFDYTKYREKIEREQAAKKKRK